MRILTWIAACALSFAAGVASVLVYGTLHAARVNADWIVLAPADAPVTYSTEAVFKSDVSLPDINQFTGQAKFVAGDGGSERLGYKVHIPVPSLDLKKVPEKYLKDKPEEIEGVKTTRPPIEQVVYEAALTFALRDSDGFILAELSGPEFTLESGKDNELQDFTIKSVSADVAARIETITVQLGVQKCLTCQDE